MPGGTVDPSGDLGFEHVFEPGRTEEAGARGDPADTDPGYTALLLHGTGADQHDLVPLGRTLAPGHPILSPLGKVREGGMPRWFARHEEGVFDEQDLRRRAGELGRFLAKAEQVYDLAPARYVAIGFSNGANIAGGLLLLHPDVLRGAVLLRPMVPLVPDQRPDLSGVPIYIAAGRRDPLIPAAQVDELADMLDRAGAEVTLRWSDGGHGLAQEEIGPIQAWLDEHEAVLAKPRQGHGQAGTQPEETRGSL